METVAVKLTSLSISELQHSVVAQYWADMDILLEEISNQPTFRMNTREFARKRKFYCALKKLRDFGIASATPAFSVQQMMNYLLNGMMVSNLEKHHNEADCAYIRLDCLKDPLIHCALSQINFVHPSEGWY